MRRRKLYERLGAHPTVHDGVSGVHFAVWAPNVQVSDALQEMTDACIETGCANGAE